MQAILREINDCKACNLKFFSYYFFMEEKLNLHEIHVTYDAWMVGLESKYANNHS